MIYYTTTGYYNHESLKNSLSKGRDDYFEVLRRMGFRCIDIPVLRPHRFLSASERLKLDRRVGAAWRKSLRGIGAGDVLIIHTPCSEKFSRYANVIERLHKKGCRIITIVFELETFFNMDYRSFGLIKRAASVKTERRLFDVSDAIVVHNNVMKEKLKSIGIDGRKMFAVGVMDYLRDEVLSEEPCGCISPDGPIVYAGNLSIEKSEFEYHLPEGFRCNLYGAGYTGKTNGHVCYKGVFDPLSLMDKMEGSFGLVWEGRSVDSCTGSYGHYLTFNNPHKIALYMASGFPVIVWSGAAMAHFVRREKCGLIADTLRDVPKMIESLDECEYERMRLNACRIGNEMRRGTHISSAVRKAILSIGESLPDREGADRKNALIIFTREPEPGSTKTRLMKKYTAEQCAELHECFIKDIAHEARLSDADVCVSYTGGAPTVLKEIFSEEFRHGRSFCQEGEDLGARMENAIQHVLGMGYEKAVLIGTDIPELCYETIEDSFIKLDSNDAVLGATTDGGYYLIGMKEDIHEAFGTDAYGGGSVLEDTLGALKDAGYSVGMTDEYSDIDEPEDVRALRRRLRLRGNYGAEATKAFLSKTATVSVIIPVYNESLIIDDIVSQLIPYKDEAEIIFVDGGSDDDTVSGIGKEFTVIAGKKGRGMQLNLGALASSGDILFFLHCDSRVPEDFISEIRGCMADNEYGCFGVKFDSHNFFMLTNSVISNHRAFSRRLPFGDQGIFIDRELFFNVGMFPELPVMEDYGFSIRMRRLGYRPAMTRGRIETSARRYGKSTLSILRTEIRMWNLRRLYRRGEDPDEIALLYEDIR